MYTKSHNFDEHSEGILKQGKRVQEDGERKT